MSLPSIDLETLAHVTGGRLTRGGGHRGLIQAIRSLTQAINGLQQQGAQGGGAGQQLAQLVQGMGGGGVQQGGPQGGMGGGMGGDPSQGGGDPSMMGGADPSMMGGDPSMGGGDPSMGGGYA